MTFRFLYPSLLSLGLSPASANLPWPAHGPRRLARLGRWWVKSAQVSQVTVKCGSSCFHTSQPFLRASALQQHWTGVCHQKSVRRNVLCPVRWWLCPVAFCPLFFQQTQIEHLLYIRHCRSSWGIQTWMYHGPWPKELIFLMGDRYVNRTSQQNPRCKPCFLSYTIGK